MVSGGGFVRSAGFLDFLPDEWNVRPVGSAFQWMCGHVTGHGSVEHPVRCPVCFGDRLRLGWERGA